MTKESDVLVCNKVFHFFLALGALLSALGAILTGTGDALDWFKQRKYKVAH